MIRTLSSVIIASALAACQAGPEPAGSASSDAAVWGPLAVADEEPLNDLDAGTGPGSLTIGPRCVTFRNEPGGFPMTLVWRSGQTRWDGIARQIVFVDRTLGTIRLSNGDRLLLGGAGLTDPESPDQGAPQPRWLVLPDPACPETRWVVHSVVRPEP